MKTKLRTERKATSGSWDELARKVKSAAKSATGLSLHQMERASKEVARGRFHGRGTMANSIRVTGPTGGGTEYTGEVGPTVIYGRIQELGGMIFAHGDYSLHNPETGQYFGRHVRIRSDHPYLKPGVEMTKPMIKSIFERELAKALEE